MKNIRTMFKRIDLTEGKPWKVILIFTIPIFLSLLLNSAFLLINSIVLKVTVGGDSVAAVNATSSISNILLQFAYGTASGFAIVIAEYVGKKDYSNLKKIFYNSIYLSIILGIFIALMGFLFYEDLLHLLNINERYLDKAKDYYQMILIAFIFMLLNNCLANALRAMGDSFAPLVISLISTFLNICFAFLFTGVIKLDTKGVAIATIISNLANVVISYIYIVRKYDFLGGKAIFKIDKKLGLKMMGLGIPLGIQWSVLFIGSFFQDRTINAFGDGLATKAICCYNPFVSYICTPISALSSSMLSYVGQNYGKKDFDRIKKGAKQMVIIHILLWVILMIIGFSLLKSVPYIFMPKDEINNIIEGPIIKYYCYTYLKVLIPCFIMQGLLTMSRSILQGVQKTTIPLLSGIGELIARISICSFVPTLINPNNPLSDESYLGVCFSTPAAWFISLIIMGGSVLIYFRKIKRER